MVEQIHLSSGNKKTPLCSRTLAHTQGPSGEQKLPLTFGDVPPAAVGAGSGRSCQASVESPWHESLCEQRQTTQSSPPREPAALPRLLPTQPAAERDWDSRLGSPSPWCSSPGRSSPRGPALAEVLVLGSKVALERGEELCALVPS